jgi:ribosomal protein L6P/L9E
LEIEAVGNKVEDRKDHFVFSLGKTHSINIIIPTDLKIIVSTTLKKITIDGNDKEKVNSFSAIIRHLKKPSVYHNKGIFFNETKKLKPTKSVNKSK